MQLFLYKPSVWFYRKNVKDWSGSLAWFWRMCDADLMHVLLFHDRISGNWTDSMCCGRKNFWCDLRDPTTLEWCKAYYRFSTCKGISDILNISHLDGWKAAHNMWYPTSYSPGGCLDCLQLTLLDHCRIILLTEKIIANHSAFRGYVISQPHRCSNFLRCYVQLMCI